MRALTIVGGKRLRVRALSYSYSRLATSLSCFQVELSFPDVSWPWTMRFQVALNSHNTLTKVSIRNGIRKN